MFNNGDDTGKFTAKFEEDKRNFNPESPFKTPNDKRRINPTGVDGQVVNSTATFEGNNNGQL
jgi:hypothetical protein